MKATSQRKASASLHRKRKSLCRHIKSSKTYLRHIAVDGHVSFLGTEKERRRLRSSSLKNLNCLVQRLGVGAHIERFNNEGPGFRLDNLVGAALRVLCKLYAAFLVLRGVDGDVLLDWKNTAGATINFSRSSIKKNQKNTCPGSPRALVLHLLRSRMASLRTAGISAWLTSVSRTCRSFMPREGWTCMVRARARVMRSF